MPRVRKYGAEVPHVAAALAGGDDVADDRLGADHQAPGTDALETNARLERRQDIKEAHGHSHGPGPIEPKH